MFWRILLGFPYFLKLVFRCSIRRYIFYAALHIKKCNEKCNEIGGHSAAV